MNLIGNIANVNFVRKSNLYERICNKINTVRLHLNAYAWEHNCILSYVLIYK